MPKERAVNPVQAQRQADKKKEIKKNRKQVQSQRNEKLARRNPERLQRQIDELKELQQRNVLRPKDEETLKQLERDVKGIKKAREALGDAAPKFPSNERRDGGRDGMNARQQQQQRRQNQHLGKRRRDDEDAQGSDTDPEVRDIPMPEDSPPPIPRQKYGDAQIGPDGKRVPYALPSKPMAAVPSKTVYSAAPQLRDLKKEAVKFLPSSVAAHKKRAKGQGRLLEPEEMDRLEKSGYYAAQKASEEAGEEARYDQLNSEVKAMGADVDIDEEARRLQQELAELYPEEDEQLPRKVQIEDVEDDGD